MKEVQFVIVTFWAISSYIRKFRVEQLHNGNAQSYMRKGLHIRKCANISPYMRRPLVTYDFATAPFWISLYMRKIWFSFLSVQRQMISHIICLFCAVGGEMVDGVPAAQLLLLPAAGEEGGALPAQHLPLQRGWGGAAGGRSSGSGPGRSRGFCGGGGGQRCRPTMHRQGTNVVDSRFLFVKLGKRKFVNL